MCKIAILDNFPLFTSGLKSILYEVNYFEIIAEAEKHGELIKLIGNSKPDILIFDILHSHNAGLKSLRILNRKFPNVPVLLIVSEEFSDYFSEYAQFGGKGFIFKEDRGTDLIEAVKTLCRGEIYFPAESRKRYRLAAYKLDKPSINKIHDLTNREITILKLFCRGLTYREIGEKLFISHRTVETHKKNILRKIKAGSKAEMIRYAYHNQIVT